MTYEELTQLVSTQTVKIVVGDGDLVIHVNNEFMSAEQRDALGRALDGFKVKGVGIGEGRLGQTALEVTMDVD